ncbi:MAG: DUF4294 domain-containing protein [Bacteroidales bacterium]|nr:DUF4294 domain-containing protein [Paludibacteraceae bacterium]MDY6373707.1 DUF4294 domain-containing protein [Bacteroidales bacterium]MDY6427729.1 DUF4294 domain-containing protein [Bacteroidales bacterium]
MKEKLNIVFVLLLILFPLEASSQFYSEALGGYMLNQVVYKGDTIPYVELKEVPVYPKLKNKKLEKFYWKTVRDVKLVYPYVKIVAKEYAMINAKFDTIVDKKQRMKYTKKYEKQLLKKYEPTMREFTLSQGKMMIKLIDREMDKTGYALIKEIRGGFVAWWWQLFAKMVGADLKEDFNTSKREQDRIIERVITLYEAGVL